MDRDEMLRRIDAHHESFWRGRVDDFDHHLGAARVQRAARLWIRRRRTRDGSRL